MYGYFTSILPFQVEATRIVARLPQSNRVSGLIGQIRIDT